MSDLLQTKLGLVSPKGSCVVVGEIKEEECEVEVVAVSVVQR
jgi:hypothetical protein